MIRSCLFAALWCGTALAQLPPPQALPPREAMPAKAKDRKAVAAWGKASWRVDATATAADGRTVPDLTAADFELTAGGKPQKTIDCRFHAAEPLRTAIMVDDLRLSPENLALVKKALHNFVDRQLGAGDQAAILTTSTSEGMDDQFTADKQILNARVEQLTANPPPAPSNVFGVGSMSALRSALFGLQFTPGRKLAVFVSEGLRSENGPAAQPWFSRLIAAADRSSVVLYAIDVPSTASASYALSQGLASVTAETGGAFFDAAGDPGAALSRIVQAQQGYYILHFETDPLQRTTPVAATTQRAGVTLRVRSRVLGLAGDGDGAGFVAPDNGLRAAVGTSVLGTGLHLGLKTVAAQDGAPEVDAVLHVDGHELTFIESPNSRYRASLKVGLGLFQEDDTSAAYLERDAELDLSPEDYRKQLDAGYALTLRVSAPRKGPYQLRVAVLDESGGRLGAASRFIEIRDGLPPLTMEPIQLEAGSDPDGRVYLPGHPVKYSYDLGNLRFDAQQHAKVEVRNQILHDGRVIYSGEPNVLDIAMLPEHTRSRISGTIKLSAQAGSGKFTLTITAVDTLATGDARRAATQTIDFEIQP